MQTLKINSNVSARFKLSPQVCQSLKLLPLSHQDLLAYLDQKLLENPVLEESWVVQAKSSSQTSWSFEEAEKKQCLEESLLQASPTLEEYLTSNLMIDNLSEKEKLIAQEIIGNLNEDGYLSCPLFSIAAACNCGLGEAQKVLSLIQSAGAPGIGAQDLQECLLIQLKAKKNHSTSSLLECCEKIIKYHWIDFSRKNYSKIAKSLGQPISFVLLATQEIKRLNPRPAQIFSLSKPISVWPDAIVWSDGKKYFVKCDQSMLPQLKINSYYKNLIQQKNLPLQTKQFLKAQILQAQELIQSLLYRQQTLVRVIRFVVRAQSEFLTHGPSAWKPLTLTQVAHKLELHKSTLSRVVVNKYVQTPHGLMALKEFFNSAVICQGKPCSTRMIQYQIQNLLHKENKESPLSDQKIVRILASNGMEVARRTVAKYRHILKVLPSYLRKESL